MPGPEPGQIGEPLPLAPPPIIVIRAGIQAGYTHCPQIINHRATNSPPEPFGCRRLERKSGSTSQENEGHTINVSAIAQVCHEANRAIQLVTGDPAPSPAWADAPEWQRASAIEGVQKALDGETAEQLHESWCAFKAADGWIWGEVKDADAKTHPCLIEHDSLPPDQRAKDHVFAGIVAALDDGLRKA